MLKKRIIPCLDIKDGRTVKGINFVNITDAGDPIILAKKYVEQGADELAFLDITATNDGRKTMLDLVKRVATSINIPFTVGGGINSVDDVRNVLNAGADKVSINSAALKDPTLIKRLAEAFGKQCVIVAIDTKFTDGDWIVFRNAGKIITEWKALDWSRYVDQLGAGEILLTSMNNDGTKSGFALDITSQIADAVTIPVIASGGAGVMNDFVTLFSETKATGALAASVFHYEEIKIPDLKNYLLTKNIPVRK